MRLQGYNYQSDPNESINKNNLFVSDSEDKIKQSHLPEILCKT